MVLYECKSKKCWTNEAWSTMRTSSGSKKAAHGLPDGSGCRGRLYAVFEVVWGEARRSSQAYSSRLLFLRILAGFASFSRNFEKLLYVFVNLNFFRPFKPDSKERCKNTALSCGIFAVHLFHQHKLAEMERFELSIPFWGIHDFQSCALDQLRDISMVFIIPDFLIKVNRNFGQPQGKAAVTISLQGARTS